MPFNKVEKALRTRIIHSKHCVTCDLSIRGQECDNIKCTYIQDSIIPEHIDFFVKIFSKIILQGE